MEAGAAASAPAAGGTQAFLAYEHNASVTLEASKIQPRLQEIQSACAESRFGECVVLNVSQQGGDWPQASISMRLVPGGVEQMIALAGMDASLGSRSTRAEDLAVVVRDNALDQQRLRKELERLEQFQSKRDLAVADMIALSKQMADVEAKLQVAEQAGAQHTRRIETQLLSLDFRPTSRQESSNQIGLALRDFGTTVATGIAVMIRAFAVLIAPALIVLFAVLAVRFMRRRRIGK